MTVNRGELARLLRAANNVQVVNENRDDLILMAITVPTGEPIPMVVSIKNDEVVQFRTMKMLMAPRTSYRTTLLQALVDLNYNYKIAKFAFDSSDGEIIVYVSLAVMDSRLTAKQIERVVGVYRSVAVRGRRRCQRIIDTGQDNTESDGEPSAAELLEALKQALDSSSGASKGSTAPSPSTARSSASKKTGGLGKWLEGDP